jgi:hypothetical protein
MHNLTERGDIMSKTVILKRIVCSECGAPIYQKKVSVSTVERNAASYDEDVDDDMIIEGNPDSPIETVVEVGPVCARCAAYR